MKTVSSYLAMKTWYTISVLAMILFITSSINAQYDPDFTLRINVGGLQVDYQGDTFTADQYAINGTIYTNYQTVVDSLYATERYRSSLTHEIPLENGDYKVILHYAEIYWGATGGGSGGVGSRVFDVTIEGQLLLGMDDFDISTEVSPGTPLLKTFTVNISDGVLNLNHSSLAANGGAGHAKISAIEILGINPQNTGGGDWSETGSDIYFDTGNVGIGTLPQTEYRLSVDGHIHTKEVKVDMIGWPDYVFEKGYDLPSLEEIDSYIQEHGHLLNIPSAEKVEAEGIELGEMNKLLLEKIEELTLYIIENDKNQKELEERIKLLKTKK